MTGNKKSKPWGCFEGISLVKVIKSGQNSLKICLHLSKLTEKH